jgi:pimeloyl-ACP methyl ester carboxylesterase
VVFIQGSGCDSLFIKVGDRVGGGIQNLLLPFAKGRARVLVVEKPGVNYLDQSKQPGAAEGCRPEFLQEHTLDRWAEAVNTAIKAAHELPQIDATKTLVVGHSEGGLVAARVAALNAKITHVASLAGGGPTQLFDLVETAGAQSGSATTSGDIAEQVYDEWKKIQ